MTLHTPKIWIDRTPNGQPASYWTRCQCGHEAYARTHDDLAILINEHLHDIAENKKITEEEKRHT